MTNRRAYKRVDSSAVLVYRPVEGEEDLKVDHYLPAEPLNISSGGILFAADRKLEMGSLIKIRLRLFDVFAGDPRFTLEEISDVDDLVAVAKVNRVERIEEERYQAAVEIVYVLEGDLVKFNKFVTEKTD